MKKTLLLLISLILLASCETLNSIKKPELKNPFSKCPPKEERTLKNILCQE